MCLNHDSCLKHGMNAINFVRTPVVEVSFPTFMNLKLLRHLSSRIVLSSLRSDI